MSNWFKGLGAGIVVSLLMLVVLRAGLIDIRWPWERLPDFATVELDLDLPEGARIASVEPVTLDCRARVHAVVPVDGVRRHRVLGQVYRTDRLDMEAIGDVDTCVEGDGVEVTHHDDGTTEVVVPGDSILFVRPRVDAPATADSVEVSKGTVGKLTDVFPWVDEDSALVPQGYAYAQQVIGGSACMQAAYAETTDALVEGYRRQFVEQGIDPERLVVRIQGEPRFDQNEVVEAPNGLELSSSPEGVTCAPAEDASAAAEPPSSR